MDTGAPWGRSASTSRSASTETSELVDIGAPMDTVVPMDMGAPVYTDVQLKRFFFFPLQFCPAKFQTWAISRSEVKLMNVGSYHKIFFSFF